MYFFYVASPKKTEAMPEHDALSPDVLNTSSCANCPRWQNKYIKAKQTLAATLEKLQAANLRKEKVDRALNKELGKTHNILCQVCLFYTLFYIEIWMLNTIVLCRLEASWNKRIKPAIELRYKSLWNWKDVPRIRMWFIF